MAIENNKRYPSCKLLFKIIREADIPANVIFYPELSDVGLEQEGVILLVKKCNAEETRIISGMIRLLLNGRTK